MNIRLLAVGGKMPAWVNTGFNEYTKRLPRDCAIDLVELPLGHRGKNSNKKTAMEQEAQTILKSLRPQEHVVVLDVDGQSWSTERLSEQMSNWRMLGQDVALIVGGPDGLTNEIRALGKQRWSLSPLTLPHPLVRVMLAEQLYRAWSILAGHPYHK